MLAAFCQSKEENSTSAFKLLGTSTPKHEGGLISNNTNLISSTLANGGMDSCSFYSGPSDETVMAYCESSGSIAYSGGNGSDSCGSIATSGGGVSVASFGGSSSCSSGGGCSYSC